MDLRTMVQVVVRVGVNVVIRFRSGRYRVIPNKKAKRSSEHDSNITRLLVDTVCACVCVCVCVYLPQTYTL